MSNIIFLSHSSKDEVLVDRFVDFLTTSLSIKRKDIFCTSLHGTKRIRTGANFIDDIKSNIINTKLVLFFITPNFLRSYFCLCELGAAWALGDRIYPILIPPVDYSDLDSTPLKGVTHLLKLNHCEDCIQLGDEFRSLQIVDEFSSVLLKRKAEKFFDDLKEMANFQQDEIVSIKEYEKLKKEIEIIAEENINKDNEIKRLHIVINELKEVKDSVEVTNKLIKYCDEWDVFEEYLEKVEDELRDLDDIVVSCIYYNNYYSGEESYWINDRYYFEQAKEMEADEYLIIDYDNGEIRQNSYHPKIKKVELVLQELDWYMGEKASEELISTYEDKYEEPFSINSRQFWQTHFDKKIVMS